jgi:hypothetical protein
VSELARVAVPAGTLGGTEVERVLEGRLPAGLAAGTYYLYAVVDPTASIAEPKRPEDLVSLPVQVVARAVVAARDDALVFDPATVAPGRPFETRVTLRNDGNRPTVRARSYSSAGVGRARGPRRLRHRLHLAAAARRRTRVNSAQCCPSVRGPVPARPAHPPGADPGRRLGLRGGRRRPRQRPHRVRRAGHARVLRAGDVARDRAREPATPTDGTTCV